MALTEQHVRLPFGPDARVFRGGSGSPLLYLHPASAVTAEDPFAGLLAAGHDVYAPVAPGFTDIAELDDVRDIHELLQWYDDLLGALGLDSVAVVGHSYGGMLAAELAAHYPARVSSLVLLAPVGLWNDDYPVVDLFATPATELMDLLWGDPGSELAQAAKAAAPVRIERTHGEIDAETVRRLEDEAVIEQLVTMAMGFTAVAKFMMPLPDKGLCRRLYRVTAPTLVVWGAKDRLVPPEYADDFARLIPGARVELIDDAGHMVPLEAAERVVALVDGHVGRPS